MASKTIVICCDGTSNSFGSEKTNVRRVFDLVDVNGQRRYYDPGVGTLPSDTMKSKLGRRVSTGLDEMVAFGLTENILEAYKFLMQNYDKRIRNRVFIFGYSRGALTARRLAKFVDKCGLPPDGNTQLIRYAWEAYESFKSLELRYKGFDLDTKKQDIPEKLHSDYDRLHSFKGISVKCEPYFVGVWDTVRSVGGHFDQITCELSKGIKHARQALAYHENRRFFKPEIWKDDDRIKQVWFAGDHGDVGGGHSAINGDNAKPITRENDLSLISLVWMLDEATQLGTEEIENLSLDDKCYEKYRADAKKLENSNATSPRAVNQKWKLLPIKYRREKKIIRQGTHTYIETHPSVSAYVSA